MDKENEKNLRPAENEPQTGTPTKSQAGGNHKPATKNPATDTTANTAKGTPGLNQENTGEEETLMGDQ